MSAGCVRARRAGTALAALVVVSGCSVVAPGEDTSAPSPAAATSAAPVPGGGSASPSPPLELPSIEVPRASASPDRTTPTTKGLSTRTTTLRGRTGSASWRITVPVFSGGPAAAEVNRRVRAAAGDLIAQVKRETRGDNGLSRTLEGEGVVVTNEGRTAQVTITYLDILEGTAHPSSYVTTTVVDLARRRPVRLDQVIQNPPEGLRLLRREVLKAAKKKDEYVDPAGLAPRIANWANWQSRPQGLYFVFADYQLGGPGLRAYTVPWKSARLVLSDYGDRLLAPR